jgi:hypothetical protein
MSGTLRLRGATSGYSELQAPAVAADQTFVLPTAGGTLLTTDSPVPKLTLELGSASQPSLTFEGDTDTGLYSSGTNTLNLVTGGSDRLVIDSSGNVGIGTSSPQALLDITDASNQPKLRLSTTTATNFLEISRSSSTGHYTISSEENGSSIIVATDPDGTGAQDRVTIDRYGNVGIGSSSPTSYANSQTTLVIEDSGNPAICWSDTGQTRDWWAIASGSALSFKYADGGGSGSATNVTNVLHLDNGGNVGVGTTNPLQPLHISSGDNNDSGEISIAIGGTSANGRTALITKDTSTPYDLKIRSSQDASFDTAIAFETRTNTERMRIDSAGRLLVGTTSGASGRLIHIDGGSSSAYFHSTNTLTGSGSSDGLIVGMGSAKDAYVWNYEAGFLEFGTNGQSRMRIDSSGKVGIGMTSPNHILTLNTNSGACFMETAGAGYTAGTNSVYYGQDTGGEGYFWNRGNNDLLLGTNNTERMRIDSSGRLLVGTSSSRAMYGSVNNKFQIEGGSHASSSLSLTRTGGSAPQINLASSANTSFGLVSNGGDLGIIAFLGADGSAMRSAALIKAEVDGTPGTNDMPGRLVFSTTADGASSPTERMRISSSGVVTIKTNQSSSARNRVINLECSGQGRGALISGNSDTDPATLGAGSDRRLKTNIRNYTNGLERIKQIPVKIYDEVNTDATNVIGWVADEVSTVFPDAVIGEPNAVDAEGNPEYQMLASLKFYPDLVQCVQTLITKIETLEAEVAALKAQ